MAETREKSSFPLIFGQTDAERDLERKRRVEKRNADALAFDAVAYRAMPADLRESAERWGVSALMEAVWQNAFGCGYRQSLRDATSRPAPEGEANG